MSMAWVSVKSVTLVGSWCKVLPNVDDTILTDPNKEKMK
jgi:hypothetical protein